MPAPDVKVRISGDDKDLNAKLKSAGDSVDGFAKRIPLVGLAIGAIGAALSAFAKGAVDEAAKAELGMVRLGTAVRNAGGNFTALRPEIEATVAKVQQLSTATDDDLREALTRMITLSGDVGGSLKNLQLVTDIAAFKQIDLGAAADIVGKAMTGNTRALAQFGNEVAKAKDPVEALRQQVGGYAEKEAKTFSGAMTQINNQWGEFQEAVGKAILGGGEMTGIASGLADGLAGLVLWVERNEGAFIAAKEAVGAVLGAFLSVGKAIYNVVQPALGPVMKGVLGTLLSLLHSAAFGVRYLAGAFQEGAGLALEAVGYLVEKGGALLKVFGIDVVSSTGTSIRAFGAGLVTSARQQVKDASATFTDGMKSLLGVRAKAQSDQEQEATGHQKRLTRISEDGDTERLTKAQLAAQIHAEHMRRANEIFEETTAKLDQLSKPVLRDMKADWSEIDAKVRTAAKSIGISTDAQKELGAAGEGVRAKQEAILDEVDETKQKFLDTVESAQSLGTSLVGVASQMGVLDAKAASTLTSVLNMGASIAKFGFGSPEGILSVINGLAQLIGGWGSSPVEQARKEAHMKNTRAIEDLTREFGDYNGAASGRVFSGTLSALGGIIGNVDADKLDAAGRLALSARIKGNLPSALKGVGITENEARTLASKYGIDVDKDPLGWYRLLQVLQTRKFGAAAGNFSDELASLEDSFDVLGVDDDDDRLMQFGQFIDKHIPALKGVLGDTSTEGGRTGAIAKLKQLYRDSISGKITPADYGGSTPQQFRQIVATLLNLLGNADGFLSSAQVAAPATGVPTGTGTLPGATASTSGLVTGGMPSTVGPGSASTPTLDVGGAVGGVVNNVGSFVVNNNFPDVTDPREAAELVAQEIKVILGRDYINQLTAMGRTAA